MKTVLLEIHFEDISNVILSTFIPVLCFNFEVLLDANAHLVHYKRQITTTKNKSNQRFMLSTKG